MSDCSTSAWRIPKWTDQVWHAPSGRAIHIDAGDEPHEVELAFADGTSRWLHYAGDFPAHVRVDGIEFVENDDDLK